MKIAAPPFLRYLLTPLTLLCVAAAWSAVAALGPTAAVAQDRIVEPPKTHAAYLKEAWLQRTVILPNSANIYNDISLLFIEQGAVRTPYDNLWTVGAANIAWRMEQPMPGGVRNFVFKSGTSILAAVRQVARARNEQVDEIPCALIIRPAGSPALPADFRLPPPPGAAAEPGPAAQPPPRRGAGEQLPAVPIWPGSRNAPMPVRLVILRMEGERLRQFLGEKFSTSLPPGDNLFGGRRPPFKCEFDGGALQRARKANVAGIYSASDLCDTICAVLDLRWTVSTNTVRFSEPPAPQGDVAK
ncbi:hypothetical protein DB346_25195 [Verrucomicrobia bacterium LW23]|nr:hypothetical protein DB346_25195 [Verrucomicrobia bacterium LW23]